MQKLKIVFQIVLVVFFVATIVFVQILYKDLQSGVKYSGIKVNIDDSSSIGFISRSDILSKIVSFNLQKGVTPIKNVPLASIETLFKNNPYINRAEVYSDVTGAVNIDIEQFVPSVRIIDSDGFSYFIDKHYKVVQQRHYVNMELPVVTQSAQILPLKYLMMLGNKNRDDSLTTRQAEAYRRIDRLVELVEKLENDDIWENLISQVNVNGEGDVELIPKLGVHIITFCNIDSLNNCDRYLDKMRTFYKSQALNGVWSEYSRVNFKYEGQVVCKKIK